MEWRVVQASSMGEFEVVEHLSNDRGGEIEPPPEPDEECRIVELYPGANSLGEFAIDEATEPRRPHPLGDASAVRASLSPVLSSTLNDLLAQRFDAEALRQLILASPPSSYGDVSEHSCNRSGVLDKLSRLEAKIKAAVDVILEEKMASKCAGCEQSELHARAAELDREEAQLLLADAEQDRASAQGAAEALQAKCDRSDGEIRQLELRIGVMEESASQQQGRVAELEEELRLKDKSYQQLWTKANASLLEKESAMATVEQQQQDKEAGAPKEHNDEIVAKMDKLRNENDLLQQQMRAMAQSEEIFRQMMSNVETEKEVAIALTKKELELKIDRLRQENATISDKVRALKRTKHRLQSEVANRASEEEDLILKNNALKQNMDLRLKEKETVIRRLQKEIRKRDAERTSSRSKSNGLEATIEEQFVELEEKDVTIATLHEEESRYKAEISRMQAKIASLEEWLHESMSFRTPPASPGKQRSSNPQSPARRDVNSNPQSPSKNTFQI